MSKETEERHELETRIYGVIPITVYRGCLVTKIIGGYEIFGTKVSSGEEVDGVIDKAGTILSESIPVERGGIRVPNNGNFATINSQEGEI